MYNQRRFLIYQPTQLFRYLSFTLICTGFLLKYLFVSYLVHPQECKVFQLYRLSLAQLEYQTYIAHLRHFDCYPIRDLVYIIDPEYESVLKGATENFSQIVTVIEIYEGFSSDSDRYLTLLSDNIFSPHAVHISTLCGIVEQLGAGSNLAFVVQNTIPGKI